MWPRGTFHIKNLLSHSNPLMETCDTSHLSVCNLSQVGINVLNVTPRSSSVHRLKCSFCDNQPGIVELVACPAIRREHIDPNMAFHSNTHTPIPYSLKEFGQILTLEGGPSISVFGLTPHYSRIWLIYRVWWSCSLHELIPFSWSNPRPSGAHVSGAQQEEEDDWGQRSMRSLSLNESTHKPAAGHPEGNDIINIKIIADSAHFYHLVSPERSNNKSIKLQSHTSTFATLVAPVSQFSQLCTGCNVIFLISNDDISLTIEKCQYISEYLSIWSVPSYFNSSMHSSWHGLNTFV